MSSYTLYHGDCTEILPTIPDQSIDAIITDPPYPEIDRDYGRLTEDQWWDLMMKVCSEGRRILKPTGSAVFILQPNSRALGSMRPWLWRFMAWIAQEWNLIQDAYWWNITAPPNVHVREEIGLMRPSVKPCVWAGSPTCYRNQTAILWKESDKNKADRLAARGNYIVERPSGYTFRSDRIADKALKRGGVTPFNLLPLANSDSSHGAGAHGHGAGTPLKLADWWTRYICPPGGSVLDMFNGAGTMGIAALQNGCSYIGIDKERRYIDTSDLRLGQAQPALVFAEEAAQ